MRILLFISILGFTGLSWAQIIYPKQQVEYSRYKNVPVYNASDLIHDKAAQPVSFLKLNQKLLPCILLDSQQRPFRSQNGEFYLGFELLSNSTTSLFQSVENNHCPSWFTKAVKASQLTTTTTRPVQRILRKNIISPPPIKKWLSKKIVRLQKNEFQNPHYYRNKKPINLAYEFHNTVCQDVNEDVEDRGTRLIKMWNQFVKEKFLVSEEAGSLAFQAKEVDLVTRTALYESNYSYGCSAKASCEKQIITLSIYNRAHSKQCQNGNKAWGCRHKGDYSGVATKPNQYNIWFKIFPIISHLTGCFLREDLQPKVQDPAIWRDHEGLIDNDLADGFRKRIAMYNDTFSFNTNFLFNKDVSPKDLFEIKDSFFKNELQFVRFYYHPMAMPRCEHKTYANSAWIKTSYVTKDDSNYFLLRRTRIFPKKEESKKRDILFKLYETASGQTSDIYPDGLLPSSDVDYTHSFLCTAYGVHPECEYDKPVKAYKKMPLWLLSGSTPKILCRQTTSRGLDCKEPLHDEDFSQPFGGGCNLQFLPVVRGEPSI